MPTASPPTVPEMSIPEATRWKKRAESFFVDHFDRAMNDPTPPQVKMNAEDLRDRLGRKAPVRNVYRWLTGMTPRDPETLDALCRWIGGRLGIEPPIRPAKEKRTAALHPAERKVPERKH